MTGEELQQLIESNSKAIGALAETVQANADEIATLPAESRLLRQLLPYPSIYSSSLWNA